MSNSYSDLNKELHGVLNGPPGITAGPEHVPVMAPFTPNGSDYLPQMPDPMATSAGEPLSEKERSIGHPIGWHFPETIEKVQPEEPADSPSTPAPAEKAPASTKPPESSSMLSELGMIFAKTVVVSAVTFAAKYVVESVVETVGSWTETETKRDVPEDDEDKEDKE